MYELGCVLGGLDATEDEGLPPKQRRAVALRAASHRRHGDGLPRGRSQASNQAGGQTQALSVAAASPSRRTGARSNSPLLIR